MIETPQPPAHVYQPGQGRRAPREIAHPLSPELLVAHLSGELPPAAQSAVQGHLDDCAACRERAGALAGPYDALAALGRRQVPFIPDLRRSVRTRWAEAHLLIRVAHRVRVAGGGELAGVAALLAIGLVLILFVITNTFQAPAILARSTNAAISPGGPGGTGLLYAQTSKIMDVTAPNGQVWPVAEIIAIDQRTAAVVLSLPRSATNLRIGGASERPRAIALAPDGATIYELTAPRKNQQALLAFDAHTGQLRIATTLTLPGGGPLPAGMIAQALAIAPNAARIYVSMSETPSAPGIPSILVLDRRGSSPTALYQPPLDQLVPEPPTPGMLPGVVSAQAEPTLDTTGMLRSPVPGALMVSADGQWLFDAIMLSTGTTPAAVVVRRITAANGLTTQSVALPGNFAIAAMAASASAQLLYLAHVGSAGGVYVLDVSGTNLVAHSEIPLGGLSAPGQKPLTGTVWISPTADGTRAYVSADTSSAGTGVSSHDIWLVDSVTNTVASHRIEFLTAGQALANGASGPGAMVLVMRGPQIVLLPPDLALSNSPPLWLRLADDLPLVRLIATRSS